MSEDKDDKLDLGRGVEILGTKMHTGDVSLLRAVATGEGAVQLTPDLLKRMMEGLDARHKDIEARYPKLVAECPYETRLAVTAWVMKAILDHARDGGTFRYLIYTRLGFEADAYVPLYQAGGMDISNEFDLTQGETSDGEGKKDGKS